MKRWGKRWLELLVLLLVTSCGTDGGVGGTGISTITGNVSLGSAAATRTTADLQGIEVEIRGTAWHTLTDRAGEFALAGEFDGNVTVDFTERDGTLNILPVEVPSGGTISLHNVRFVRGAATPERIDVDFEATVLEDAMCDGDVGTVEVGDRNDRNAFVVRLDGATYQSDSGRCDIDHPQCSDLLRPRIIRLVGTLVDGGIRASRVRLINCRQPGTGGR